MIQTWAILVDAYRELNARKMFWIAMAISLLVVSVFLVLGINDRGLELGFWTWEVGEYATTKYIPRTLFYKTLFSFVGLTVWLGIGSTALALVSTSSLIPDFVSGGAIENMLSKPVSRARLFLTKYVAGLLFVILQTTVFVVASILIIGVRGGVWMWPLLWAIPLVTLSFSYLYSVSALVGVWTRSTLAALIAALALWGAVFATGYVEGKVLEMRLNAEFPVPLLEKDIEAREAQITKAKETSNDPADYAALERRLTEKKEELAKRQVQIASTVKWHSYLYTAKTLLPKTSETRELVDRALATDKEMAKLMDAAEERERQKGKGDIFGTVDYKVARSLAR
ncbi:MAG: ABC transporter permease subunit [Phycisphaerales bacterium]